MLLNAIFAIGVLVVFCKVGSEPSVLIGAWGYSGFNIYLDNGVKIGNYEDYKYLKEQVAIRDYRYTNIAP